VVDAGDAQVELRIHFRRNDFLFFRQNAELMEEHRPDIGHVVAVAERKALHVRGMTHQGDAHHRGRVDEVDQPCFGGETAHIVGDAEDFRQFPEGAEDASRADGVTRAHGDAVLFGDPGIQLTIIGVAVGEREHHKIGVSHHLAPVGGTFERQRRAGRFFRPAGDVHHRLQHRRIGVHQCECAFAQDGAGNHVVNHRLSEKVASGADHHDLRTLFHTIDLPQNFDSAGIPLSRHSFILHVFA